MANHHGISGYKLGVELYQLWRAGKVAMPEVAEAYLHANAAIAETGERRPESPLYGSGASADEWAFARSNSDGSTSMGEAFPHWQALRDELQTILADSALTLIAVGETLVRAAHLYAATDHEAAGELKRSIEKHRLIEESLPPPRFPHNRTAREGN